MENENLELDVKPTGNKDLWLFLIIIDIIFLCVFGYFLYKHFSVRLFQSPTVPVVEQVAEDSPAEKNDLPVVEEPAPIEVVSVAAEPEKPLLVQPEEIKMSDALAAQSIPVHEPVSQPTAPQQEEVKKSVEEKKESVIVKVNPKSSKYRRVTFRWFGEGKKVSIVSGFTMAKPQALKKRGDYWETTLSIAPGTYKFLYIVDGVNTKDPYSEEKDGRSLVVIK